MADNIELHPDWIEPTDADLVGVDGNAFAIIGYVTKQLRHAGNSPDVLEAYRKAAMAGDYDHLLRVSMTYTGMMA